MVTIQADLFQYCVNTIKETEATMTTTFLLERLDTPLGEMLLACDEQGKLRIIDWLDYEGRMRVLIQRQYPGQVIELRETNIGSPAADAIQAYFDGDINAVSDLEVATGGTEFQRSVWAALRNIPAGQKISYLELATRIGNPAAVRAVGLANGANPVSIVVPCHRVIGSGSKAPLVGYGGGLERKRWLLQHERAVAHEEMETALQASLPGF